MNKILIISLFVLAWNWSFAQNKNDIIQQRIEFIAEELESEDIALEDVFDLLYYYYDHPINLNNARKEDLEELLLLSEFQINELLNYIKENGELTSIYELQNIQFWDVFTIENVMPFIVVKPAGDDEKKKGNLGNFFDEGKTEIFSRVIRGIEEKAGYADVPDSIKEQSNAYYWGSPERFYNRVRFTYRKNLSMGVTMEKDPGEEFFGTTQPYGFDFYSAHAYLERPGKFVRKITVGDYQMQVGQGVALWTGYAFNKTVEATKIRKNARGLRPYTSVDETRFLRGAGLELGVGNFSLTTWGSHKGVDGSLQIVLDSLSDEESRLASSINLSGLHRTTSEIERKNSVMETIYGSNLKYESNNLQVGITAVHQMYDTPLERADRLSNKYEFSGEELTNFSADYAFVKGNVSLFGELARSSSSGSFAGLQGLVLALGKQANFSFLYRNYPKDYHTFYARGFGESARTINESGFYAGTNIKLSNAWTLNAYLDVFKTPWLTFRSDAPTDGHEYLTQLKYRPNPRFELFLRYREQRKMQNVRNFSGGNMRPVEDFMQRVYRFSLNYKVSKAIQWKTRLDYVTDERESMGLQQGVSVSQDLVFKLQKIPLQIYLRYAIFETDGFDARIYAFESNLQNVFSIPTYFGQGTRSYVMFKYSFWNNKADLWLRYAAFVFANQDVISSGAEQIQGSVRSEFGAQVRLRF